MEPEQNEMAKELLALRQQALKESLNGKGGKNGSELPQWVTEMETAERKKTLKAVEAAIERLETDDFGFCTKCYVSMPWADISRIPEREICDSCTIRSVSQRHKSKASRSRKKAKAAK